MAIFWLQALKKITLRSSGFNTGDHNFWIHIPHCDSKQDTETGKYDYNNLYSYITPCWICTTTRARVSRFPALARMYFLVSLQVHQPATIPNREAAEVNIDDSSYCLVIDAISAGVRNTDSKKPTCAPRTAFSLVDAAMDLCIILYRSMDAALNWGQELAVHNAAFFLYLGFVWSVFKNTIPGISLGLM